MSEPKTPDPNRIWWYLAIGFAIFWMVCLALFVPSRQTALENTGMSEPADYNWTLVDLNDQPVPFARFKGKTVFLNIWATWCGPCVREMPSIARLARNPRLQGKDIAVVCVSTDNSSGVVRRFLTGKDWPMTILRAQKLPPIFSTDGIPATFLIGTNGRIAASTVGGADWDEPEVVEFMEKLAASPPGNAE